MEKHRNPSSQMKRRYQEFDVAVGRLFKMARVEGHTIPCSRGCDACCYDVALVTHLEMPPVIETLRTMAVEKRMAIRRRVVEWFAKMGAAGFSPNNSEPDRGAYYRAHLACPLLDREKHDCLVYSTRPIACRGHHVLGATAAACKNVGTEPSTPSLLLHQISVPLIQALVSDQTVAPGQKFFLAMAPLPAMLWAVWHLVEHPELSITEWLERVNREGLTLALPAEAAQRAG